MCCLCKVLVWRKCGHPHDVQHRSDTSFLIPECLCLLFSSCWLLLFSSCGNITLHLLVFIILPRYPTKTTAAYSACFRLCKSFCSNFGKPWPRNFWCWGTRYIFIIFSWVYVLIRQIKVKIVSSHSVADMAQSDFRNSWIWIWKPMTSKV